MPEVLININGRNFAVACDEGEQARVRDMGAMVDERVRQLTQQAPPGAAGETHLLVLAGLMLADELSEAKAALAKSDTPPRDDEDLLVAAVDHLAERIEVIAGRLPRP